MEIGFTLFVMAGLIIAIWIIIEIKRMKHKLFAFFLIGLILFSYVSFSVVMKDHDLKLNTVSGLITAGELYLSWLGSMFINVKSLTAKAIKMDWAGNDTS